MEPAPSLSPSSVSPVPAPSCGESMTGPAAKSGMSPMRNIGGSGRGCGAGSSPVSSGIPSTAKPSVATPSAAISLASSLVVVPPGPEDSPAPDLSPGPSSPAAAGSPSARDPTSGPASDPAAGSPDSVSPASSDSPRLVPSEPAPPVPGPALGPASSPDASSEMSEGLGIPRPSGLTLSNRKNVSSSDVSSL